MLKSFRPWGQRKSGHTLISYVKKVNLVRRRGVIQVSNAAHGVDKMQAGMVMECDNMVIGDVSKSSFYVIGGVKEWLYQVQEEK